LAQTRGALIGAGEKDIKFLARTVENGLPFAKHGSNARGSGGHPARKGGPGTINQSWIGRDLFGSNPVKGEAALINKAMIFHKPIGVD